MACMIGPSCRAAATVLTEQHELLEEIVGVLAGEVGIRPVAIGRRRAMTFRTRRNLACRLTGRDEISSWSCSCCRRHRHSRELREIGHHRLPRLVIELGGFGPHEPAVTIPAAVGQQRVVQISGRWPAAPESHRGVPSHRSRGNARSVRSRIRRRTCSCRRTPARGRTAVAFGSPRRNATIAQISSARCGAGHAGIAVNLMPCFTI